MLKNYTVTLDTKETELFRLKVGNLSAGLRQLIRADVNLEIIEEPTIDQLQVFEEPEPFECDRNIPCWQCNQQNCDQRVAPYKAF